MSDQAELITRPPSHPLATSLLAASILGTIGAIAFVWVELFGEYMPAPQPGAALTAWEQAHNPVKMAQSPQAVHDHYRIDFPDGGGPELLPAVERELGVSNRVGDPSIPADVGGGEEAPVEAPPAETPPAEGETPPVEEPGGD